LVTVPSRFVPLRNSTFDTVPSGSLAAAVSVMAPGWMKVVLLVGKSRFTIGGWFGPNVPLTLAKTEVFSAPLLCAVTARPANTLLAIGIETVLINVQELPSFDV